MITHAPGTLLKSGNVNLVFIEIVISMIAHKRALTLCVYHDGEITISTQRVNDINVVL
jgi:hypothetical protein